MTDDLARTLRRFVDAESDLAAASAPEARREADALARRVGRRRAVRTGASTLSAAAVIVALVIGVTSARRPDPEPPAIPAPTVTTSRSSGPTEASTAAAATTVTTPPLLSDAELAKPGMLEATDTSWRLLRYEDWATPTDRTAQSPAALYLLSPDGHVDKVPTPADPTAWYLLDWLPGTSLAVVHLTHDPLTRVIDLTSGTTVLTLSSGPWNARFVHDGTHDIIYSTGTGTSSSGVQTVLRRVTTSGRARAVTPPFPASFGTEQAWLLNSSGTTVLVNDTTGPRLITSTTFAPMSLPSPYPARPGACRAWRWVTDTEVLEECTTAGTHPFQLGEPSEFWLTTVGSGEPRQLSGLPSSDRLGGLWQVGSRLVAGSFGPPESEASWWDVREGGMTPLSHGGPSDLVVVDVQGSELIAILRTYDAEHVRSVASLVAIDPVRGTTRTLVSAAPAGASSLALEPSSSGLPPQTGTGD